MLATGRDDGLHLLERDAVQQIRQLAVDVGRDAAGAAIRDQAVVADRAEVAARGDVALAHVHIQSQRLKDAASD